MYVATVPNRNSPPAILLRESYRLDGKVKTRTIATEGVCPDPLKSLTAIRNCTFQKLQPTSSSRPPLSYSLFRAPSVTTVDHVRGIPPIQHP